MNSYRKLLAAYLLAPALASSAWAQAKLVPLDAGPVQEAVSAPALEQALAPALATEPSPLDPGAQAPLSPLKSVWRDPGPDPQAAAGAAFERGRGSESVGRVMALLGESEIARPYVDFHGRNPIPIAFMEPTEKLDRVQPGQSALFDQAFRRIDLNERVFPDVPDDAHTAVLAPTVLHELKHYKTRVELGDIATRENEVEAYDLEARYILERIRINPGYLETLPPAVRYRYEDLLEAWVQGPRGLASFVLNLYIKVPSVFDDPAVLLPRLKSELEVWKDKIEHYEEHKRELAERAAVAKKYDGFGGDFRVTAGPSRAALLAAQVENYSLREAVEHAVVKLVDAVEYWSDPSRIETNRAHYTAMYARIDADWRAWKAENPGFRVRPPGWLERTAARVAHWLRPKG